MLPSELQHNSPWFHSFIISMETLLGISKSEKSDLKDVFEFFKQTKFKLPKSSKTPLGRFIAQSKEEKLENYSRYELVNLLDLHIRDFIIVDLENEIFEHFLVKNSLRFNPGEYQDSEPHVEFKSSNPIKLSSKELAERKDNTSDTCDSGNFQFYISAIEQEIREMHNSYQREVEKHESQLSKVMAKQKSVELHLEKIDKTRETFETFIVKSRNNKMIINPANFAEFLRLALKQDKDDVRKLKVLLYQVEGYCKLLKKMYQEKSRHKVDLQIELIQSESIKHKLDESDQNFLITKKILDDYSTEIDKHSKLLDEKNNKLAGLQKELRCIQNKIALYKRRKIMLDNSLENDCVKRSESGNLNLQDFWTVGKSPPDQLFYAAGKLSCSRMQRQIDLFQRRQHTLCNLINVNNENINTDN